MINQAWIDEENQVLRQKLIGDTIIEEAPRYFPDVKKLLDKLPARYSIVDMSEADARKILNRNAREHITTYSSKVGYEKVAYVNIAPTLRMIAKILRNIAGRNKDDKNEIRFFKTDEEALSWLKGKK
jgi:hypothetical protein